MNKSKILLFVVLCQSILSCINTPKKNVKGVVENKDSTVIQSQEVDSLAISRDKETEKETENETTVLLDDTNAIPFFFEYAKHNLENKVRIKTDYGNIDIQLFENTPYHRANFIYLTKKKYFDKTTFHRVVPGFIIQGGNSDNYNTVYKRREIGRYLLPPDTRKGHSHHRGVISMPSSKIDNPYKLASPFEFFIVQQKPGAYHLDGSYTAFGKVIKGMEVVDKINTQETDAREAPLHNIYMTIEIIE